MRITGRFIKRPVYQPMTGLAIGDSIVAPGYGQNSIPYYVFSETEKIQGLNLISQAVQGADINNQRDLFFSDENKLLYDFFIMQIAINNFGGGGDYAGTKFQYQRFVNELREHGKPGVKIYASLMTPARELLITRGDAQVNWELLNADIAGTSSSPITGLDGVITQHVAILGDTFFNLKPEFEISGQNDHIHINNSAKQIIGNLWHDMILGAS